MIKVYLKDGRVMERPNVFVTVAIVGVCFYEDDFKASVLYPWHMIDRVEHLR